MTNIVLFCYYYHRWYNWYSFIFLILVEVKNFFDLTVIYFFYYYIFSVCKQLFYQKSWTEFVNKVFVCWHMYIELISCYDHVFLSGTTHFVRVVRNWKRNNQRVPQKLTISFQKSMILCGKSEIGHSIQIIPENINKNKEIFRQIWHYRLKIKKVYTKIIPIIYTKFLIYYIGWHLKIRIK